ncbi:hypothetical protein [Sphingomonas sp. PL20]|uniref:hypothetical protein n=1 Tax=unclassified Sphingomonas TaxID=196159 RepID=UPI00105CEF55
MSDQTLCAAGTSNLARECRDLAHLCEATSAASRELDGRIARTVFPGLVDLEELEIAVWRYGDGSRVRALRYSGEKAAAATLVPPGHWMERDANLPDRIWIYGPGSDDAVSARHVLEPLAISAACLRMHARLKGMSPSR